MKKRKPSSKIKLANGAIDLSDWTIETIDAITDCIHGRLKDAVQEVISVAMEAEETGVSWPHEYSDKNGMGTGREFHGQRNQRVSPLTVYLEIGLGVNADENPEYAFNIRESLKPTIEQCRQDGSYSDGLKRIMAELRNLANEIDAALPKE